MQDPGSGTRRDRWFVWPTVATLAASLAVALWCTLPGPVSALLVPLTAYGAQPLGAGLLVVAFVVAVTRRRRMAVSILVAVVLPALLWKPILWTADCLHLALTVGTGAGQLGRPPDPDGPFVAYDWSVGFAGATYTFLIYDATDAIARVQPPAKRSTAAQREIFDECAGKVTHLLGHYYVCTF